MAFLSVSALIMVFLAVVSIYAGGPNDYGNQNRHFSKGGVGGSSYKTAGSHSISVHKESSNGHVGYEKKYGSNYGGNKYGGDSQKYRKYIEEAAPEEVFRVERSAQGSSSSTGGSSSSGGNKQGSSSSSNSNGRAAGSSSQGSSSSSKGSSSSGSSNRNGRSTGNTENSHADSSGGHASSSSKQGTYSSYGTSYGAGIAA